MAMASASSLTLSASSSSSSSSSSSTSVLPALGLRISSSPLLLRNVASSPPLVSLRKCNKCLSPMAVSLPVLTFDGSASGADIELDLKAARAETARAVVHRGVIAELQNRRRGTASTLTRGEVRGGGRKPYKQKKTGRARRGSQRTPLRPGGGVIFGPKPRDWSIKVNRKEKQLAISTALQKAAGSFIVVEDFEDKIEPRTKVFISAMKNWGADPAKPCLLFTTNATENLVKSSRNLSTLKLLTPRSLNLYDVLKAQKLIVTKSGIEYLNGRYGLQEVRGLDADLEGEEEGDDEAEGEEEDEEGEVEEEDESEEEVQTDEENASS